MLFYGSHVHTEKQLISLNWLIYGCSSKELMQTKPVTVLLGESVSYMISCQVWEKAVFVQHEGLDTVFTVQTSIWKNSPLGISAELSSHFDDFPALHLHVT